MTELIAGQNPVDRRAGGSARGFVLAAVLGALTLSACSILPGGDDPDQPADDAAAEVPAEDAGPVFTPVAAEAPSESEVGRVTILYPEGNADLPEKVTGELDRLADQLAGRDDVRLELHAYAKGDEDQANRAKLFSLKRGMRVRSHLHKNGIVAQRVVLRPLGIESGDGPEDRVDIVLLQGLPRELDTRIASAGFGGQIGSVEAPERVEQVQPGEPPEGAEEQVAGGGEDEAAQRARLAQLQQADGEGPVPPGGERAGPVAAAEGEVEAQPTAQAGTEADVAEAGNAAPPGVLPQGVIPQGDAPLDPDSEGSLVARFEAIAAADVQLAEDPDLQATIARTGGVVTDPDGSGEESVPSQLAESPPAATDAEAAFVSKFAQPEGQPTPAEPQFSAVPDPTGDAGADPAVNVASGDAFEAAMAGTGAQPAAPLAAPPAGQAGTSEPVAEAPASQLQSVVVAPQPETRAGPSVAALPPAGTMTTDPAADRGLYLIQFEADSPDMTADGRAKLRAAIEDVLSRPDTRVRIVAHAEGGQDDEFLMALSAIRRNEVEGAMRNSGVHWGRIWSKAVGDKKPDAALADNNIVEIIIRQK